MYTSILYTKYVLHIYVIFKCIYKHSKKLYTSIRGKIICLYMCFLVHIQTFSCLYMCMLYLCFFFYIYVHFIDKYKHKKFCIQFFFNLYTYNFVHIQTQNCTYMCIWIRRRRLHIYVHFCFSTKCSPMQKKCTYMHISEVHICTI